MRTKNVTPAAVVDGENGMILVQGDYDTGCLIIDGHGLDALTPAQWKELKDAGDRVLFGMDARRAARQTRTSSIVPDSVAGTPYPGRTGYVVGTCGCPVPEGEWNAGHRKCEGC